MLHIAICDDDETERTGTRALIEEFLNSRDLVARIREFSSAKELLFDVGDGSPYDLYLLDVVMPEMNGIRLGVRLREIDETGTIIYLTTSEDFAIDSYEARAFWYLVKPVIPDKLFFVLDKVIAERQKMLTESVSVKTMEGMARVPFNEIIYAESVNRAMRYVLKNGDIRGVTDTASFGKKAAPLLSDDRFILCGASLVLNLQHIRSIDKSAVVFDTDEKLEIPRRVVSQLRLAWQRYLLGGGQKL